MRWGLFRVFKLLVELLCQQAAEADQSLSAVIGTAK